MLRALCAWAVYPLAERAQGRQIRAKVPAVRRQMALPFAERVALRRSQLADVLERAGRDVPYYQDLFARLRFDPQQVHRDLRYLNELPYLTKDTIRAEGSRLISRQFYLEQLHVRKTGGSTGPSTLVYYSNEALDWTAAVNIATLGWAGKRLHAREVHLASRFPEVFPWRDRVKEQLKCLALNRTNVFTADFEPASLARIWARIRQVRPYLVQAHPSTLYAIASWARDARAHAHGVFQVFESTGEVLDDRKRDLIEQVFGCRCIDRFGNAEFGILAYESLQERKLRVLDWVAWPEVAAHEGGTPELVFTSLMNSAMPLVRYRTGDLAELHHDERGYYLSSIVGRVHDLVQIGASHYPTHYVQDLLDRLGGIEEFQISREPSGNVLLRLVVPDIERRAGIAERIQGWWPSSVRVEFVTFDQLVRTGWRGKFRYLVPATDAA